MPRSTIEAALAYAARGIPVLPLHGIKDGRCTCEKDCGRNAGKHPHQTLVPNGLKDASTDAEQVGRWFRAFPGANLGIVLHDLVAIDEDEPGSILAAGIELPNGPVSRTGRGHHYLFKLNGRALLNGRFAPGLDCKTGAAYIVAPPSMHASGKLYSWVAGHGLDDVELTTLPESVEQVIDAAHAANGSSSTNDTHNLRGLLEYEKVFDCLAEAEKAGDGDRWRKLVLQLIFSLIARGARDDLIISFCRRATWTSLGWTHKQTDEFVATEIRRARAKADRPEPEEDDEFGGFDKVDGAQAPKVDLTTLCLTPDKWAARQIPPQDLLLGSVFSTTTRTQLIADTGLGKTMTGLGISFAIRLGRDFLGWDGHREAKVIYLDGEMPAELIKERLALAHSWFHVTEPISDGFWLVSREDLADMPPLDKPEAKDWLLDLVDQLGGADHITFDNIGALTSDCLKEEDGARVLKELQRDLTKRKIGQLWLHHTGHDSSRGYGSKMREWHLDTVMVAERLEAADTDVSITLKFPKSRRRTPNNRSDYGPFEIVLRGGEWSVTHVTGSAKSRGMGKRARLCLDALKKALDEVGTIPPYCSATAGTRLVVTIEQWREFFDLMSPYGESEGDARRQAWKAGTEELTSNHTVCKWEKWVWITQKPQA